MFLLSTAHQSPTIHVCFRAKHIKAILTMKTRLLCCNIWSSIFKFLFLKGESTNPAVFCCFCLKGYLCFFVCLLFVLEEVQREGCEKEVKILEERISQKNKKKNTFNGNKQCNQKAAEKNNFTVTKKGGDWLTTWCCELHVPSHLCPWKKAYLSAMLKF